MGDLAGRYVLASREGRQDQGAQVFACRARSISPTVAVLQAPVRGKPGEGVVLRFEELGVIRASIARRTEDGFVVDLICSNAERLKLAARIAWLKSKGIHALVDRREHKRWPPRVPKALLHLPDKRTIECFVVDVSASGVAVSADVTPELGSRLSVGELSGQVMRRLETGFAVKFDTEQDPQQVEARLGSRQAGGAPAAAATAAPGTPR